MVNKPISYSVLFTFQQQLYMVVMEISILKNPRFTNQSKQYGTHKHLD